MNLPKILLANNLFLNNENEEEEDDYLLLTDFPKVLIRVSLENNEIPKLGFTNLKYKILWIEECPSDEKSKQALRADVAVRAYEKEVLEK